jgi:F0F1-type ATP synthase membrane subunit b/b'
LFKPYLAFIKEEDKKRIEVEHAYADLEWLKAEASKEASLIIEEAKKEALAQREKIEEFATKEKERIIEEATVAWKVIIKNAETEAEKMKLSMLQSVKSNVLDLALRLNSKIFWKETTNRDFLEKELEAISK